MPPGLGAGHAGGAPLPPAGAGLVPLGGAGHGQAAPGAPPAGAPVNPPVAIGLNSGDPAGAAAPAGLGAAPGVAAPGVPVGVGEGFEGVPGGGGGAGLNFGEKGTLEYVVQKLLHMAKTGDYSDADDIISDKAKSLAAEMRDARLTPAQIESFKATFEKADFLSRKAAGGGTQFSFRAGQNQIVQILVVKEGSNFRVKEVKIQDGRKK